MLETFYSKINSFNSEVKGRINTNNTSDNLIKIIEYMDIYRKRLKTILDYQRNSHKTLRAYEVGNKPNNTKASKKKQRKKQLNQILKKIIKLN